MLGGSDDPAQTANARWWTVLSQDQARASTDAINRSRKLLADLRVYPFSTCVEPCCGLKLRGKRRNET